MKKSELRKIIKEEIQNYISDKKTTETIKEWYTDNKLPKPKSPTDMVNWIKKINTRVIESQKIRGIL